MEMKQETTPQEGSSILLCVATEKGYAVLRAVHGACLGLPLRVSTFREVKVVKGYDETIRAYAEENHLPFHSWQEIRQGGLNWLQEKKIWGMLCVGWRYMVPREMVDFLGGRVLATHDSLLPRYRGYAPLASALINGEEEVGVSVLFACEEVDAGDIVYQGRVSVGPRDRIGDLIRKVVPLFQEGVVQALRKMIDGQLTGVPQDHAQATFNIWRDEEDLWINWHESAQRIERTIRALSPPYMGARTRLSGEVVVVHDAVIAEDLPFEIRQPGKVWRLTEQGQPVVVCGEGMLLIREASIGSKSLLPLAKLRTRFGK